MLVKEYYPYTNSQLPMHKNNFCELGQIHFGVVRLWQTSKGKIFRGISEIRTKIAITHKQNHLWAWNSLEAPIMEPAFSGYLCLVGPSPVVGWREIDAQNNFK